MLRSNDAVDELIPYYEKCNMDEFAKQVHEIFGLTYEQARTVYFLLDRKQFDVARSLLKHWLKPKP